MSDPIPCTAPTETPCNLSVQRWPDRKRPTLCLTEGNVTTILATFPSDAEATIFMMAVNERLEWAYTLGRGYHNDR